MFWLVTVFTEDGEHYRCVAQCSSESQACFMARRFYRAEGEVVEECEAEMFNTFQHGDTRDYENV